LSERRTQAVVTELIRLQPEGRGKQELCIPDATTAMPEAVKHRVEFAAQ
jgi:hypothetical protein